MSNIVINKLYRTLYDQYKAQAISTSSLYQTIDNDELKYLFSLFHYEFNEHFSEITSRKKNGLHYKAQNSRDLIKKINEFSELRNSLSDSKYCFDLIKEYEEMLAFSKSFLSSSNGSDIPDDIPTFIKVENKSIYNFKEFITLSKNNNEYQSEMQHIGEGSYAHIYKYKDDSYDEFFAIKKLKKEASEQEKERFRHEFDLMKKNPHPFILKVYKYNEDNMSYTMEFADYSLEKYIQTNNQKISIEKRKKIVYQILIGMNFLHNKQIYHRDISPRNILVIEYDDTVFCKISDFGLAKIPNSLATSTNTEIKGAFNDFSDLGRVGFNNYEMCHEMYALAKLVYFIMTGRTNTHNEHKESVRRFINGGINSDTNKRYKNVDELKNEFEKVSWE